MTTHKPLPANEIARTSPYKPRHAFYLMQSLQPQAPDDNALENKLSKMPCECGEYWINGSRYRIFGSKYSNYTLTYGGLSLGFFVDLADACEYMKNHIRKMNARESKDKEVTE